MKRRNLKWIDLEGGQKVVVVYTQSDDDGSVSCQKMFNSHREALNELETLVECENITLISIHVVEEVAYA